MYTQIELNNMKFNIVFDINEYKYQLAMYGCKSAVQYLDKCVYSSVKYNTELESETVEFVKQIVEYISLVIYNEIKNFECE